MPDRRRRAALRLPPTAPSAGDRSALLHADMSPAALALPMGLSGLPAGVVPVTGPPAGPASGAPASVAAAAGAPASVAAAAGALVLRERQSSAAGESSDAENPFAPPPQGRPDQPWRPREPRVGPSASDGSASGGGAGGSDDAGGDGESPEQRGPGPRPPIWSSRQPGRQDGGWGTGPGGRQSGPQGPGGPGGMRWDPTDPVQRRARYALLTGMWGFFFALFSLPQIALLLGALAVYWGVSSLRGKPRRSGGSEGTAAGADAPGSPAMGPGPGPKPQATAAISGLVTGGLALAIVAATFTFQIVYRDYYQCVNDALTQSSRQACQDLLPKELRPVLRTQG